MNFFKKQRVKIAFRKMSPLTFSTLFLSCAFFIFFILSITTGNIEFPFLLYSLVFLAACAFFTICRLNNDEYRELIRQAKLIGDLETVGETIENLKRIPTKDGILKANESLIFHSGILSVKIIIPSKITEILVSSYYHRGAVRYSVVVRYLTENSISISTFSEESANALCDLLKNMVAPHLLNDAE